MRPHLRSLAATALIGLVLGACTATDVDAEVGPSPTVSPNLGASPADNRSTVLGREVDLLTQVLVAAHTATVTAAEAPDVTAAKAQLEVTVHLLTADPATRGVDLDGDREVVALDLPPLLPGPEDAIGDDAVYDDVFNRVLTAARDAGSGGASIIDVLRDPLTGDIGVWQGDAAAALDLVTAAARKRTLDDVATAVADVPGAAAQALAYARWGLTQRDLEQVRAAGSRAGAHLQLALDLLRSLAS